MGRRRGGLVRGLVVLLAGSGSMAYGFYALVAPIGETSVAWAAVGVGLVAACAGAFWVGESVADPKP